MFDIGFLEILLICVVALLILGPDKLPGAIRTMGLWIGRLRRNFDNIKRDIEKEIGADEIRRQLRNEAILEKFNESKKQITDGFGAIKQEAEAVRKEAEAVRNELDIKADIKQKLSTSGESAAEDKAAANTKVTSEASEASNERNATDQEKPAHLKGGDGIIAPYPLDKLPTRKTKVAASEQSAEANKDAGDKAAPADAAGKPATGHNKKSDNSD